VRTPLLFSIAITMIACGGAEPPPPAPVTAPATTASILTPMPAVIDAGVAAAPTIPTPTYPAPKPTTISLVSPANDACDQELKAGDDAFEANDLDGAQNHYLAAKKAGSKRSAPLVGIARVQIAKQNVAYDYAAAKGNKEIAAAAKDLKNAVKLDPTLGVAQVELGRALLLLGDAAGAIDALKKGVTLLPNEPEAHSALGVAWLATGHGDEAADEMGKAAQLDPGSAARHGNYGTTLLMRGKTQQAIGEYQAAVAIDDSDARAHSDLGTALLGDNQVTRALPELRRAIALDPKRATFHSNLGYALQIDGKTSDAEAEYREAIKDDPALASAWINLATLLAKDPKRRTEARAALEKAKAIDPTDPRVKANLEELDSLH
jgi:Flp pilus assembly protein TadD